MSANPQAMQAMLMQALQAKQQPQTAGGGSAGPVMQSQVTPLQGASQIAQKIMLMKALQGQQPGQPLTPSYLPGQPAPQQMNTAMPGVGQNA